MVVPFWMAGDHMVAWGTVNKSEPLLMFVDTGLAGFEFTCPESTLREAGVKVLEDQAREGIGGGGKTKVVPFITDELTLGSVKAKNIPGVFSPFPPSLEHGMGFRIGGLISHGFLRPYALTIDFTGMRFFLHRKEE